MELEYVTNIRRTLHENPEIGLKEHKTTALIKYELDKLGVQYDSPLNTGCIAYIEGTSQSAIAFRADIDALPIQEENDVPYRSKISGLMHACGHDGHTSMLLALIKRIKQAHEITPIRSTVYFIFQPSEESNAGANILLSSYEFRIKPEYIFGLHLQPEAEEGILLSKPGPITASATEYRYFIEGTTSHVANRHEGASAAEALTIVLNQLTHIQHYHLPGLDANIIHIGKLYAGEAINTVPSNGYLEGTIRTFKIDNLETIKLKMQQIAKYASQLTDNKITVQFSEGYPPTVNHEDAYSFMINAINKNIIQYNEIKVPYLFGEDFSFYGNFAPSCFLFLGCKNKQHITGLHTSTFDFDEKALLYGIDVMHQIFKRFEVEQ
ncbi:M20 metallopeptidase family protein [Macrococcus armenti]|uniref:M20 metallopeptidase family protein n=1 Tax=Macrococcus armenti TaxID=2875764 RepID=UPI001CCA87E4|nr:amidohydrolase [Macrococcus armenti]UBH07558.1 amidohydrolase [Macrococcus armenti]UBH11956.1 amidohydrolase [Macrococcus armenti]